jgi:c-di-GMP-related signal transduction protein
MNVDTDSRQSVHIARQAILDINRRVCGYELLYRAQSTDRACTEVGDLAAARVVTDALLGIGLDSLTGGLPAFINFTHQLLLDDAAALLPPEQVVIELREDLAVDDDVILACRDLRARGYTLALDDFVADSDAEQLIPFASYVKLDVLGIPPALWQPVAKRIASNTVKIVAERVETVEVVNLAKDAGCTLFQGHYFCKPATQSAKALPARRLAYLSLFSAINKPDLSLNELEDLVKRDVSLTMRVLRSINSAAYALPQQVTSVRHALQLLGMQQVKNWASIWAMAGLNSGGTPEAVSVALLRARTCEVVGTAWSGTEAGAELFLAGMCSMLPAIVDQPMEKAISGLHLTPGVRDALMGDLNQQRSILDAVIAHEEGDWDESARLMEQLHLHPSILPAAYTDALSWARNISTDSKAA